jgi:hypothetical protein
MIKLDKDSERNERWIAYWKEDKMKQIKISLGLKKEESKLGDRYIFWGGGVRVWQVTPHWLVSIP